MTQAIRICVQALSVVGGLGVSMFLTLLVIPCVYHIINRTLQPGPLRPLRPLRTGGRAGGCFRWAFRFLKTFNAKTRRRKGREEMMGWKQSDSFRQCWLEFGSMCLVILNPSTFASFASSRWIAVQRSAARRGSREPIQHNFVPFVCFVVNRLLISENHPQPRPGKGT